MRSIRTRAGAVRIARVLGGALALVLLGVVLTSCGGVGTESAKVSGNLASDMQRAGMKLDRVMVRNYNYANDVSSRPYKCLNRSPIGGPLLAACESTCKSCQVSLATLKRRVTTAYARSPRAIRVIYRNAYVQEMHNLTDRHAVMQAYADYARVHGASSYAGRTEFDRAKILVKAEDASANRFLRLLATARKHFSAYLAKLD